jgi:hypothetical protein
MDFEPEYQRQRVTGRQSISFRFHFVGKAGNGAAGQPSRRYNRNL